MLFPNEFYPKLRRFLDHVSPMAFWKKAGSTYMLFFFLKIGRKGDGRWWISDFLRFLIFYRQIQIANFKSVLAFSQFFSKHLLTFYIQFFPSTDFFDSFSWIHTKKKNVKFVKRTSPPVSLIITSKHHIMQHKLLKWTIKTPTPFKSSTMSKTIIWKLRTTVLYKKK